MSTRWRRPTLCALIFVWLLSPTVAVPQSSARVADGHYQKGLSYAKSKPPDYASAAVWYRRAAELGHAAAQNDLGWLHEKGLSVQRDHAQAAYWYRLAAGQGNVAGQTNIGWMHHNGWGVPRDYAEAIKWYRLAAGQGSPIAADNLGVLYRDGVGVGRDHGEAVGWFRKAARAGYAPGQTNLGFMYHNGWGVPRDFAEADEVVSPGPPAWTSNLPGRRKRFVKPSSASTSGEAPRGRSSAHVARSELRSGPRPSTM
jgi:TPR repeat protein